MQIMILMKKIHIWLINIYKYYYKKFIKDQKKSKNYKMKWNKKKKNIIEKFQN